MKVFQKESKRWSDVRMSLPLTGSAVAALSENPSELGLARFTLDEAHPHPCSHLSPLFSTPQLVSGCNIACPDPSTDLSAWLQICMITADDHSFHTEQRRERTPKWTSPRRYRRTYSA